MANGMKNTFKAGCENDGALNAGLSGQASSYDELDPRLDVVKMQDEVLDFWERTHAFEKSVEDRRGDEIVFYDGPPFPTGKPHHGTVLVSFIKDMIARYWTMRGFRVPRVWGWDCHGLPIENQAETLMGITDKNEIEGSIGIDTFNEKCFEIVSSNNDAWMNYVKQMARWVDYDGAYKTMNRSFMESVMWAFKQCYDKGYIYRDYRVTPYCMHCETSLSISDTRESDSTRPRQDRWIIAKFKLKEQHLSKPVYMLAWTTTPWTLPSNLCLAVGKVLDYSYVDVGDEVFIACTNVLSKFEKIFGKNPVVIKECKGEDLLGLKYEPLFPYFSKLEKDGAFRVVSADYVGSEEGVGIVHTAPAYGEDDYWTCKANGIPLVNPVDEKGHFTAEVLDFYEPNADKNVIEMNPVVIRYLYDHNQAVADGTIEHNYPHCWRCKRPLIYKAMDAWYFDVGKLKNRLIELNEDVKWVPETVKHGRFGKWLANARDWNISRNRYWSTPIPIWQCKDCGARVVLGSIDEIYEASGVRLDNLHRQYMDTVTFPCKHCGGTMVRVPEVLDCWFESGSVPFAQKHYPFENKEWFDSHFPSDFIVEYTGQIRCWFYYLHVLAVALFDRPAFKNCVVHGTILAKDGKKLSKSSKNYTDPMELMRKYGTDSFRLYLYQTNAMLIGDLLFDEAGIQDAYQQLILPYWNACKFFVSYARIDGYFATEAQEPKSDNQLDRWVLAKLYETEKAITANMDAYQVNRYVGYLGSLLDGLTNWYIRRSRRRFWGSGMTEDKKSAYETLHYVLVNTTKLLAPVAPLVAERVYQTLIGNRDLRIDGCVHLAAWPNIPERMKDDELLSRVNFVQDAIYVARSIRSKNKVKNRQPLSALAVALPAHAPKGVIEEFRDVIAEELNVKNVEVLASVDDIATVKYAPNFAEIKARYPDQISPIISAIKRGKFKLVGDRVVLEIDGRDQEFDAHIVLVTYLAKEGHNVESKDGIVVSLDLTLTEDLVQEGCMRDVVRNIQEARKQLGCSITEHILISVTGLESRWLDSVCRETLAELADISDPDTSLSVSRERGEDIVVKISRKR